MIMVNGFYLFDECFEAAITSQPCYDIREVF